MVSTENGVDVSQYHLSSHTNLEKVNELIYKSIGFSFISLLHHRAYIISLTSLQLHHHTLLIKLTSITSLHLNHITYSKLITSANSITFYTIIITLHHSRIPLISTVTIHLQIPWGTQISHSALTFVSSFHKLVPLPSRTISGILRNYCFFPATSTLIQGRTELTPWRRSSTFHPNWHCLWKTKLFQKNRYGDPIYSSKDHYIKLAWTLQCISNKHLLST